MLLAHAARLLANARSLDALAPIARAAGVTGPPAALPRRALAHAGVARARSLAGPGALRALAADVDGCPLRDTIRQLAATLSAQAPDLLWLLVLRDTGSGELAIAAWSPTARGPAVAALVTHPARVVDSDADTLRTLAAAARPDVPPAVHDLHTHAAWLDALGRRALGARFYHALEGTVAALAHSTTVPDPHDARTLALLYTTRVLFLAFLQAKGWLDGDPAFLAHRFDACMTTGGDFHRRVLRVLFFGVLNTRRSRRAPAARIFGRIPFLNGGLFTPTAVERRHRHAHFGDAELGALAVTLLGRHRFTAREDSASWSEAAVDPEMLGRAFESLMYAGDRRASGTFYTPHALVEQAVAAALHEVLTNPPVALRPLALAPETTATLLAGGRVDGPTADRLRARVATLRVLDPACGSGAFLVHALERLAALATLAGDPRPTAEIRRTLCTSAIFGVDVNPTAVWLCELRLWLSVVIDDPTADPDRVPPLPNLDHNVRVGDTLAVPAPLARWTRRGWGGAPWGPAEHPADAPNDRPNAPPHGPRHPATLGDHAAGAAPRASAIDALRVRYTRLTGPRKQAAARRLDAAERTRALAAYDHTLALVRHARADLLAALRTPDLFGRRPLPTAAQRQQLAALRADARTTARRRRAIADGAALPFGFAWHFADAAAAAGFDLVVGNPPWVRPHALAPDARLTLRTHYASARRAAWTAGAALGNAGPGFAAQADLAAPFTERALALTRPGGTLAFLLPSKLWRTLSGGGIRSVVAEAADVRLLADHSDAPAAFDAVVYPSLLVARRHDAPRRDATADAAPAPALDRNDPASPWLDLPPATRAAFDALRAAGRPLGAPHTASLGGPPRPRDDRPLTRPTLGVKSGRNEAFLVEVEHADGPDVYVRRGDRHGTIERALLRPVLRGEDLARERPAAGTLHILWPYDELGRVLTKLPPNAARWLAPARAELAARCDARGGGPWWALFRTGAADARRARVVWPDLARRPHPHLLPPGDPHVPLNTCYVAHFDDPVDARAFATLLRSPPIAGWLTALAEPARGGYHRFLAWTVGALPMPADWPHARTLLAALEPDDSAEQHTRATAHAYRLTAATLAPLVELARSAAAPRSPDEQRRAAGALPRIDGAASDHDTNRLPRRRIHERSPRDRPPHDLRTLAAPVPDASSWARRRTGGIRPAQ